MKGLDLLNTNGKCLIILWSDHIIHALQKKLTPVPASFQIVVHTVFHKSCSQKKVFSAKIFSRSGLPNTVSRTHLLLPLAKALTGLRASMVPV